MPRILQPFRHSATDPSMADYLCQERRTFWVAILAMVAIGAAFAAIDAAAR